MKPTPTGWPRISAAIYYEEPAKAIDWICSAFGFELRMKVEGEGGSIEHSELTYGDGLIMVGAANSKRENREYAKSPKSVGGNTQSLCIVVDDADAHCAAAKAAGAKIVEPPTTHDYGEDYWSDRAYMAEDFEGHRWWFLQRVRDQK